MGCQLILLVDNGGDKYKNRVRLNGWWLGCCLNDKWWTMLSVGGTRKSVGVSSFGKMFKSLSGTCPGRVLFSGVPKVCCTVAFFVF